MADSGARAVTRATAVYVLVASLITLLGWILDRPRLTDWVNSGISAFPNAAICAVLCSIGIWANGPIRVPKPGRNIARILGCIVAIVGGLTLFEHVSGVNVGIDTLLFQREWGQAASAAPMRMGPPASTSYTVIGIALIFASYTSRMRRFASALAVCTMIIPTMSLVGYWYGADQLFGIARLTGIAFQTSTMLAALSIALMFSIPEFGLPAAIGRNDAGGFLVRRLLLPSIGIPLVFGWFHVLGQRAALFDTGFGTSIMVLATIGMLVVLLSWTAAGISRQTERTAVDEQNVREQREWLRVVLSSIGDAVIATDTQAVVTFLNPAAESLTGWTEKEAAGLQLSTVVHIVDEDTREEVENPAIRAMREGSIAGLTNHAVLIRRDGTHMPIDDAGAPIRNADGSTIGSVLIFRDVTQRRLLEKEREAAVGVARRLAAIVESSQDAIIATDFNLRITAWNDAAERMFGYSANEVIGQSIRLIVPEDRWAEQDEVMGNVQRGAKVEHFETERMRKSGAQFPVSLSVSPIFDSSGQVAGASKILRDITERKRVAEAETRARQAAEEANRAKDEFLAMLSHELRNPLSSILGWAVLLKNGQIPFERAQQAAEIIERNARVETHLVESLLDLSRIAAGKLDIQSEWVDVAAIVQSVVDSMRPSANAKAVNLQLTIPPSPVVLLGDPSRLQQVFSNLLTNAVKFTAKGGRIQVICSVYSSETQIQITDNGEGIDPEFIPHMFDRFRQADRDKSRVQGGLGLGLAIVRELVFAHGGKIIASSPGKGLGSTFTVTLPIPPFPPNTRRR